MIRCKILPTIKFKVLRDEKIDLQNVIFSNVIAFSYNSSGEFRKS